MFVGESSRFDLHQKLREGLGDDHGNVLMEHLPPVGCADVATKHDLAALAETMDARFKTLEARFETFEARFETLDPRFETMEHKILAQMRKEINDQTRTLVTWLLIGMGTSTVTVGALAFGAAKLV